MAVERNGIPAFSKLRFLQRLVQGGRCPNYFFHITAITTISGPRVGFAWELFRQMAIGRTSAQEVNPIEQLSFPEVRNGIGNSFGFEDNPTGSCTLNANGAQVSPREISASLTLTLLGRSGGIVRHPGAVRL